MLMESTTTQKIEELEARIKSLEIMTARHNGRIYELECRQRPDKNFEG